MEIKSTKQILIITSTDSGGAGFPLIHPEIILSNSKYRKALNEFMFPKLEVKKLTKSNKIINLFLRLKKLL